MRYKYLFMDLDETSIINHHLSKENREAIEKAQEKGVKFIPCTGRDLSMIQEILEEMHVKNLSNQYSVCCNGAVVKENNGNVIYFEGIDAQDFKIFIEYAKKVTGVIILFAQEGIYIMRPNTFEVQRKIDQKANPVVYEEVSYDLVKELHIIKMMISEANEEKRNHILEHMPEELAAHCEITTSSGRYIEWNAKGVTKGNGMKALMEYLNDSLEHCIAIGDHNNDYTMIELAGLGCAVENAVQRDKDIANYVCENDYEHFALKEVIDKFILKKEGN
ncbi:MAG: HAD family hydrolase [Firmicutes bacterium]|nr:HAD family hydrolase [Bacillota bacterium]